MIQQELFGAPSIEALASEKLEAYVALGSLAWASLDLRHRVRPRETAEERAAMDARLVVARKRLADAWDRLHEARRRR